MPANVSMRLKENTIGRREILGLFAAALAATTGVDTSVAQEKVIAVSFPNYSKQAPVITTLDETKRRGQELGYTVVLDDPGDDLNKQVNTIKTWISQKVSVIIAVALNPEVFEGIAKQARDAGIIWLTYAAKLQNQDATIGFDLYEPSFELGTYAGKWIKDNLADEAQVVILGFEKGAWGQKAGRRSSGWFAFRCSGREDCCRTGCCVAG